MKRVVWSVLCFMVLFFNITILAQAGQQPGEFSITAPGNGEEIDSDFKVKWSVSSGASYYTISIINADTNVYLTKLEKVWGNSYSVDYNDLDVGYNYRIGLVSYSADGTSRNGGQVTVLVTGGTRPEDFEITAPDDNEEFEPGENVTLKWTESVGSDYYEVRVRDLNTDELIIEKEVTDTLKYRISSSELTAGHNYMAAVNSYNDYGKRSGGGVEFSVKAIEEDPPYVEGMDSSFTIVEGEKLKLNGKIYGESALRKVTALATNGTVHTENASATPDTVSFSLSKLTIDTSKLEAGTYTIKVFAKTDYYDATETAFRATLVVKEAPVPTGKNVSVSKQLVMGEEFKLEGIIDSNGGTLDVIHINSFYVNDNNYNEVLYREEKIGEESFDLSDIDFFVVGAKDCFFDKKGSYILRVTAKNFGNADGTKLLEQEITVVEGEAPYVEGMNSTFTVVEGNKLQLNGTVYGDSELRTVTAVATNGTVHTENTSANPNAKSFSLSNLTLDTSNLEAGTYTLKVFAKTDFYNATETAIRATLEVKEAPAPTISAVSIPEELRRGDSFSLSGIIHSNEGTLEKVHVNIHLLSDNSYQKELYSKEGLGVDTFDLKEVGALTVGSDFFKKGGAYRIDISAKNKGNAGGTVLYQQNVLVTEESTTYVTGTKDTYYISVGENLKLSGTVWGETKLTKVAFDVTDGKASTGSLTLQPNTISYDLSNVTLNTSSLAVGTYTIRIWAKTEFFTENAAVANLTLVVQEKAPYVKGMSNSFTIVEGEKLRLNGTIYGNSNLTKITANVTDWKNPTGEVSVTPNTKSYNLSNLVLNTSKLAKGTYTVRVWGKTNQYTPTQITQTATLVVKGANISPTDAVVPKDEAWLLVFDENANLVKNATVAIKKEGTAYTNYTYQSGAIKIKLDDKKMYPNISVKKSGYLTYSDDLILKGGQKTFIKLYSTKRQSKLLSATLNGKDLLRERGCVNTADNPTINLLLTTTGTRPNLYTLSRNGEILYELTPSVGATKDEVKINLKNWNYNDGEIFISGWYYTDSKENKSLLFNEKLQLDIIKNKTNNGIDSVEFMKDAFTFTVDESVPILGGSQFTMDTMVELPIKIDPKGGVVEVYIGNAVEFFKDSEDKTEDKIKELFDENNKALLSATTGKGVASGFDVEITAYGYGSATIDNNNKLTKVGVTLVLEMKGSGGVTFYTFAGPVPVYVDVNGEISNETEGTITLFVEDNKIKSGNVDINNTLSVSTSLGAGVGLNNVATIKVTGNAGVSWEHKALERNPKEKNKVNLELTMDLQAILLFWEYRNEFASRKYELYPEFKVVDEGKSVLKSVDVLNASEYTVLNRDYIMETEAFSMEPDALKADGELGESGELLVNGLYPDAKPQVVKYNGTEYLFYLDDQKQRSDEDRTALVYRKRSGNSWTEPVLVYEDGTADFGFSVNAGTDGIYILWQNAIKSLAGIDSIEKATACINLQAARLTESGVSVLKAPAVTSGKMPMLPSLVFDGCNMWSGWYENSENELLQNNLGKNVIYLQKLNTDEKPQVMVETDNGLSTLKFGMFMDKVTVAYTADTDNDMGTIMDREIYLVSGGSEKRLTENGVLDSNPQFGILDGKQIVCYYRDGNFVVYDGTKEAKVLEKGDNTVSDSFLLITDSGKAALIWKNAYSLGENQGQGLVLSYYENSKWGEAFRATNTNDILVAFSGVFADGQDGMAELFYTTRGEASGKEINRLYAKVAKKVGQAQFVKFEYDERIYQVNQEFPMTVTLKNVSGYTLENCNLIIKDANGTQVFSQAVEGAFSAQQEKTIAIKGFAPQSVNDLTTYTMCLYSEGDLTGIHTFALGGVDFELTNKPIYDENEELLNLSLKNNSLMTDSVKLSIYAGDGTTLLMNKKYTNVAPGSCVSYICTLKDLWAKTKTDKLIIIAESLGRKDAFTYNNTIVLHDPGKNVERVQVKLNKNSLYIKRGTTSKLTATVTPDTYDLSKIQWMSNNTKCVTVDSQGNITAHTNGIATVIVYTEDGTSYACVIYVVDELPPVTVLFKDIKTGDWWVSAIQYVYDNNIMAGMGDVFKPTEPLSREQFAQVLYNHSEKPAVTIGNTFPDVKEQWYKNAVLWANENNIASGYGNGKFGIGDNITREQLAMMLYKYAKLKGYDLTTESGRINKFADGNKVSNYAKTALDWAITQGIINGKGKKGEDISTFRIDPQGNATRAECASMIKTLLSKN